MQFDPANISRGRKTIDTKETITDTFSLSMMDRYLTYEARLASFQNTSKKRASTAGGRGKALNWPHKQIAPESLARAGFYFEPYPENPDNCVCFLCGKGLDGWEAGDDPLEEHLKHAPQCGWAIVSAIEAEMDEYSRQDPTLPHMVEARKATFVGKWPHEGRKGWKCKTKQLVEAGWKYTPTDESDDMATCAYCQLALDGWEPSDKPYDEHYNRSPDCAFFALLNEFGGPKKKNTRGRAAGGPKASRLSMQSVATTASDIASVADMTAEPEDSLLTTTSTMTQGGKKIACKKKKATATKGRTKMKKVLHETEQEEEDVVDEEPVSLPKPTKPTRGKKRTSEAQDDSVVFLTEAPAPKKQATHNRQSSQVDSSTIIPEDVELVDAQAKKSTGRARSCSATSSRKHSALGASVASLRAPPGEFPDDEEIERQLEADLERALTDDEEIARDSESERSKAIAKKSKGKLTTEQLEDYAMFDPAEIEHDEDALDDELRTLQAEMEVEEPKPKLHVAKKGRKPGTGIRKASKQTKAKKAKAPSPSPKPEPEATDPPSEVEEHEASIGSTETVMKNIDTVDSPPSIMAPRRAVKSSLASNAASKPAEAPAKCGRRPNKATGESVQPSESSQPSEVIADDDEVSEVSEVDEEAAQQTELAATSQPEEASSPLGPSSSPAARSSRLAVEPPSTPPKFTSPAPSARQAALSPSPSPQSSDAENLPPSSVPPASAKTRRVVLAPVTATPARNSPSKRNMLAAGLQSQTPWTAVDIDAVMGTPRRGNDKENAVSRLLKQGKELSSPEKRMTVEEWIYFNAGEAEKKLKHDCEAVVTQFEREGTKAMNVLEGLSVE